MEWKVRGIRGAITIPVKKEKTSANTEEANTEEAIKEAVEALLDAIEKKNQFNPEDIVCVFFTATNDLKAAFPAKVARKIRPKWKYVPLLDLQQMYVKGDLQFCIRILIQINTNKHQSEIVHCYLGDAENLRPDL